MAGQMIATVRIRVARFDRNDMYPGHNWLVTLSTPGSQFGTTVGHFVSEDDARTFAADLAARNDWSIAL